VSQNSTVSTESKLWAGQLRTRDFSPGSGKMVFLSKASRLAVKSSHLPVQLVRGALSLGVNWPGHDDDHSLPSSAEVKSECYTATLPYAFIACTGTTNSVAYSV
jgi:hypothetical protein